MRQCRCCGVELEQAFRFCPWCAEPQRRKIVEFFQPHAEIESGARLLRVSRYLGRSYEERHVRFSVWNDDGRAESAISVDDSEAERLATFLLATRLVKSEATRASTILDRIRAAVGVRS